MMRVEWIQMRASAIAAAAVLLMAAVPATAQELIADAGEDVDRVECASPDGTDVNLDGTGSSTGADITYLWTADGVTFNDATLLTPIGAFPVGTTTATLAVTQTDATSGDMTSVSDTVDVTVIDTGLPTVHADADPDSLWPPNHELQEVWVEIEATDACSGDVDVTLESLTSSEPDNGRGDGNTINDIQDAEIGSDDRHFRVRAERSGRGPGRVYTAIYRATDAEGNYSDCVAQVHVPHDQRDIRDDDEVEHPDEATDDGRPNRRPRPSRGGQGGSSGDDADSGNDENGDHRPGRGGQSGSSGDDADSGNDENGDHRPGRGDRIGRRS